MIENKGKKVSKIESNENKTDRSEYKERKIKGE